MIDLIFFRCSAYLVTVFYDDDRIITTCDDNLPIIEIDENYSFQTINSDLQFLLKVITFLKYLLFQVYQFLIYFNNS